MRKAFSLKNLLVILAGALMLTAFSSASILRAATFDSDLVPAAANTYKIGVSAGDWQSINNLIFFASSNVGVGAPAPNQALEVNGGLRLNTNLPQPTCSALQRGTFWVAQAGGGFPDSVVVCYKNVLDQYLWAVIY
ncbi:MAG: hypothetical protein A3A43_01600 [Candidatus Liptonbacteria bacterium RIFCSPLOWO2_01_FULL_56_20]|uniref:Uncharacterized protein n=1 Tax=Candidatus Liptonbacteria bacterium RIFCSPLOWO2_01_FULL_56_20 TaxID=1798652 RepID=A0A1G2CJL0_9BACT|nr:MAG: Carbohydrate-binding family V/XII [Parcubacteria group bacterium GW2011_GWB1_56_8]OGY97913.1 MAG: hypothetical protein A2681_00985 [Candidatus Liptonbacteria bacterium RIFCSPHIGHO2_01_FULL_56_18b]OGZ01584.1 MAG: hypothetical protein A3A43_01600 [Candidatus Liptonbacteria bacterium RIFCSPLOWO2_01_FULL_56_20]